jgi:hypothetical protein
MLFRELGNVYCGPVERDVSPAVVAKPAAKRRVYKKKAKQASK